jgi:hypothetical protein
VCAVRRGCGVVWEEWWSKDNKSHEPRQGRSFDTPTTPSSTISTPALLPPPPPLINIDFAKGSALDLAGHGTIMVGQLQPQRHEARITIRSPKPEAE